MRSTPRSPSAASRLRQRLAAAPLFVEKLNREIDAVLTDPKLKARLADLGGVPMPMAPADFGKLIADETEKWGRVIRDANIKAE